MTQKMKDRVARETAERFHQSMKTSRNGASHKPDAPLTPTLAEELQAIFFNGTEHHAKATIDRDGNLAYGPREGNPSLTEIEDHLSGDTVLGSYTLLLDSTVRWLCFDVDTKPFDAVKAHNLTEAICEKLGSIPFVVEYSGNKGYHVWVFFTKPVKASRVKEFGDQVRDAIGAPKTGAIHVEVYPKQEKLTESSPMGNLVKLPLGKHPTSNRFSVLVKPGIWEAQPIADPLPLLQQRIDFETIEGTIQDDEPIAKLVRLLAPYWVEGERHTFSLEVSGFLLKLGWSKDDLDTLLTSLVDVAGGDIKNVLESATDTLTKISEGKPVIGFNGLTERLPSNVFRTVIQVAGQNIADPVLQALDRLRCEKGQPFQKVRSATKMIFAHLGEVGRFVKTVEGKAFWFEHSEHRLIDCDSPAWISKLYELGLNMADSFSKQVDTGLHEEIIKHAETGKVYHKFHYDGRNLWVNFGGAEVYRLDGKAVTMTYNGEQNVLFDSVDRVREFEGVNLLEVTPVCPWELLTSNINFEKNETAKAEAEQQEQLLRAYILTIAFPELHPTKAIGLMMGPRGSGKTSASRSILRFFNGMDDDVLAVAEDKPDSLRASVEGRTLLVLDNLESCKARWLPDFLSRLSTGSKIELRRLHKTNELYTIYPKAFAMLSAIDMPKIFEGGATDAVASRLLPLQIASLSNPRPENFMQQILSDSLPGMWAGMLEILNQCTASLHAHTKDKGESTVTRLADFANFCYRLRDLPSSMLDSEVVQAGINNLSAKQGEAMGANSPVLQALQVWIEETQSRKIADPTIADPRKWMTAAGWLSVLQPIAVRIDLRDEWVWKTAKGLSNHMNTIEGTMKKLYGVKVQEVPSGEGAGKMRKEYKVEF